MKLKDFDLNKLVVFNAVARHGGYKGAAEELNITRSALSQSITQLEDVLGRQLFNRVGARLRLTESAQLFHQELLLHHQNIQSALASFRQKSQSIGGSLRLGAYLEFTKSKLMPVIEEYMSAFSNVQVKFVFDSPSRLHNLLENEKIDLAISIFPHRKSNAIESRKLYQEELALIGHIDIISTQLKKENLAKLPVIDYYPQHLLFKRWWHHQFSQHLKSVHIASYAASAEMVYELVKRRLGIGVVPLYVVDHFAHSGSIQIIQPTEKKLIDHVWLSQFKHKNHTRAHVEFVNLVFKRFQNSCQ